MVIDTHSGKRRARIRHRIERASFGLLNESGAAVIGGQSEIAAFDTSSGKIFGVLGTHHQVGEFCKRSQQSRRGRLLSTFALADRDDRCSWCAGRASGHKL